MKTKAKNMTLLPCEKDACQECAVKHHPDDAHNKQSLYYQYKFYGIHGRFPTWADAIAHCSDNIKKRWKEELKKVGAWDLTTQPNKEMRDAKRED